MQDCIRIRVWFYGVIAASGDNCGACLLLQVDRVKASNRVFSLVALTGARFAPAGRRIANQSDL